MNVHVFLMRGSLCIAAVITLFCCSRQNAVEDFLRSHGLSYPVDTSRVSVWEIRYAGIERNEMAVSGAREYVEEGILFSKEYLQNIPVHELIPGADAAVESDPVLFRDESGAVGLMVKITAYGNGDPDKNIKTPVEWIGNDRKIWKTENFACFGRNDHFRWEYKSLVY